MPKQIYFLPYKRGSTSLKHLKKELNAIELKLEGSRYRDGENRILVNWGNGGHTFHRVHLNNPINVRNAIDKLRAFRIWNNTGVSCPEWTRENGVAQNWNQDFRVLGRDLVAGKAGKGITIYEKGSLLNNHVFYTKYFRKQREFRVHIFNGQIIFLQEKLKERGNNERNKYIRSHCEGWVFAFQHLENNPIPGQVLEVSRRAVQTLGLDFGGVDVGFNNDSGPCVFEVNTAPGIEESCLKAYGDAFKGYVNAFR